MAAQQEGAALGEGCAGRAGLGGGPTSAKGQATRLGRAEPQDPKKGRRGMLRAGSDRREVDNRGKRRGFGKEELKKGEAKLQNNNSNLIQERFR